MKNRTNVVIAVASLLSCAVFAGNTEKTKMDVTNLYLAYYSPQDVKTQAQYQNSVGVHSTIIWEMSGDVDPVKQQAQSLIYALANANTKCYNIAYWADWNIYATGRALPYKPYFIPGAIDSNGAVIPNQDFDNKVPYLNAIVYSFLEVAPDGTVYFNDPWSDLLPTDPWCNGGSNPSCSYAYTSQGKPYGALFGNFEALANYNAGKQLDKFISIGGYGHDASFENILGDSNKITTFVNTAFAIVQQYKMTGVDLDYENPSMTATQSQQYAQLVQALNDKFAGTSYQIMVTSLSDPAYLLGQRQGSYGYAANVLSTIANLPQVVSINLMTYDFYGAFNYDPNGNGKTGFLADTYLPNNAVPGAVNFSAQSSIETLISLGIPAAKISGGIPTYGHGLQSISAVDGLNDPMSGNYSGLYASIPATAVIPRGDLDDSTCNQSIYPLVTNSCSGSYTYAYIINTLNNATYTTVDWTNNAAGQFNGTTTYTNQYTPPVLANYNLEVSNLSSVAGGQVLSISNGTVGVGQLDWMNPNMDKVYNNETNPSMSSIQGVSNLIVTWNSPYTGKQYTCTAFNFTSNMHVMINPETGACDIKPM